ncbi:unnamed protein product [Urochloa humidicola]
MSSSFTAHWSPASITTKGSSAGTSSPSSVLDPFPASISDCFPSNSAHSMSRPPRQSQELLSCAAAIDDPARHRRSHFLHRTAATTASPSSPRHAMRPSCPTSAPSALLFPLPQNLHEARKELTFIWMHSLWPSPAGKKEVHVPSKSVGDAGGEDEGLGLLAYYCL